MLMRKINVVSFPHLSLQTFPYCRRPRGRQARGKDFVFISALDLWQPRGSSSDVIGRIPEQDVSPHPVLRNHHQGTGDWKGLGVEVFSPPKNLPSTAERLEE